MNDAPLVAGQPIAALATKYSRLAGPPSTKLWIRIWSRWLTCRCTRRLDCDLTSVN
jgi:hypothetical protein